MMERLLAKEPLLLPQDSPLGSVGHCSGCRTLMLRKASLSPPAAYSSCTALLVSAEAAAGEESTGNSSGSSSSAGEVEIGDVASTAGADAGTDSRRQGFQLGRLQSGGTCTAKKSVAASAQAGHHWALVSCTPLSELMLLQFGWTPSGRDTMSGTAAADAAAAATAAAPHSLQSGLRHSSGVAPLFVMLQRDAEHQLTAYTNHLSSAAGAHLGCRIALLPPRLLGCSESADAHRSCCLRGGGLGVGAAGV